MLNGITKSILAKSSDPVTYLRADPNRFRQI
jgi:hypothetical protein